MGHTLTGLDSGALILAGGFDDTVWSADEHYQKEVWLLKNNQWTLIGQLQEVSFLSELSKLTLFQFNYMGAATRFGQYIYAVAGRCSSAHSYR